ncbi:hypothetical protein RF11_14584 [Thelohanellus kitauei]|uniref:Uncharacterized protein n=1 Tax=Thelohanellus kitauei TaxID=669202 RepID=A0A0C2JHA7_THEKT|nr:hypothetical protein RF11_14584 [Thelohanellus kitauei]
MYFGCNIASEELKFWGSIAGSYKSAAISFINHICRRSFPPETIYDYSNKISTVMMLLASIKGFSSQKMEIVFSPALEFTQPLDRFYVNNGRHVYMSFTSEYSNDSG